MREDFESVRAQRMGPPPDDAFGAALRRAYAGMPMPDRFPAFGRPSSSRLPPILADDAGYLWILEYHFPEDRPQGWNVFDREGVFLGSVSVPAEFTPTSIGDDQVVGVFSDEFDVEHVQLYDLIKPSQ